MESWEKIVPNIHRNTSTTSGAQSPGPLPLHHLLSSELKGAGKGLGTFLSFLVAEINFSFLSEWSYERIRLGGKLLISKNFSPSLKYTYFWKHFYSISYHLNINKLIKKKHIFLLPTAIYQSKELVFEHG